jgi:hypothetical protein
MSNDLHKFLVRELPKDAPNDLDAIKRALDGASRRYERLMQERIGWESYRNRRKSLEEIQDLSKSLTESIGDLDVLSREDLEIHLGSEKVEALLGHLVNLDTHAQQLLKTIQAKGRPRNLAEESWVHDVADIYENNFRRKATVSGSGSGSSAKRGKFFELLTLSLPESFPKHGKLHSKHLMRILKRRSD